MTIAELAAAPAPPNMPKVTIHQITPPKPQTATSPAAECRRLIQANSPRLPVGH
jgi:hypothetical protein